MKRYALAALAALSLTLSLGTSLARAATEVAGIKVDERARVGNSDLVMNGAGLRTKVFFKVYVAALYLPEKAGDTAAVLAAKGPKRIAITLKRDLAAEKFVDALKEGIEKNSNETEQAAIKDRLQQFAKAMLSVGEAKEGSFVTIDWLPESGTRLSIGGQQKGSDLPGEDFYRALLKIWLGNEPAQDDLKQALLGKAS